VKGRLRFALALLLSTRSRHVVAGAARHEAQTAGPLGQSQNTVRVALLRGCVMEGLFAYTNSATERVLERNRCEIVICADQVCCGALHAHAGQIQMARRLARQNIDAFGRQSPDKIIVNAAGCGAAMKEYGHLLKNDPAYCDRAREFSERV